ncbi:MAG: hypothetical protein FJW34_08465 [Acidobacteria bacterium]|nr:hypothetical protein [Acidobacteriota bacterium]
MREKFWKLAVGGAKKAVMATVHAQLQPVYRDLSTGQPCSPWPSVPCASARRLRMMRHHIRCLGRLGISAGPMLVQVTRAYRCNSRQKPQPQLSRQ